MNAWLGQGHRTSEEIGIVHLAVVHVPAVEGQLGTFGRGWQRHVVWSEPALVLKHTICVFALLVVHFSLCISSLTNEDTKNHYFPFQAESCVNVESSSQAGSSRTVHGEPCSLRLLLRCGCFPDAFLMLPVLFQDLPWPREQLRRCMVWSRNPCSRC